MHEDSLSTARESLKSVDTLMAKQTEQNLKATRAAWKAARVPYQ